MQAAQTIDCHHKLELPSIRRGIVHKHLPFIKSFGIHITSIQSSRLNQRIQGKTIITTFDP